MAQRRLLVVAALLGLQAGARADDTPAPTAVISTISPTITLSPTAYTPPNNEDDNLDWTDDVRPRSVTPVPSAAPSVGASNMTNITVAPTLENVRGLEDDDEGQNDNILPGDLGRKDKPPASCNHNNGNTPAGAAEGERDLNADRSELKAVRRRKRGANVDRHVDLVRGRGGDVDTTESQRDMLDLTMTNAWSATTTTASTHTRHRGTDELSEI